ncbi:MAG TPA: lysylphosphatidylglycerol synthase transmembrane domain-containing protein [Ktedonobacteraceae bacterium]|nr:lysylphosphatidylglycerol synthase transmembrane domain-containing protein [Ktedonobacteraceae bacterium]
MQSDQTIPPFRRPPRLIKDTRPENSELPVIEPLDVAMQTTISQPVVSSQPSYSREQIHTQSYPITPAPAHGFHEIAANTSSLLDVSEQATKHLMRLSGMMPAIHLSPPVASSGQSLPTIPQTEHDGMFDQEEGWWPNGIQQTGPLPIVNLYGSEPFGKTLPLAAIPTTPQTIKQGPIWKVVLNKPVVKVTIGLAIGIGMLFLVARYVDIPMTIQELQVHLATPRGLMLALLCGLSFVISLVIRGARWGLFLRPLGKIKTFKVIQIFMIGTFLNFLLPVRGGEVAKSLILKRTTNIPVSQSLPTVAMDKALDLLPALFIIAIVPFLGVQMNFQIWLILGLVSGLLVGLVFVVGLAAWKRSVADALIRKITGLFPKILGGKIEAFAIGFVDSLLMGASRPKIFISAILLTGVAVIFEGLFAMLAFWTVGTPLDFGTAIFGYTLYNMFYILPTPPGQVGSNEIVGLLVFSGLLHLAKDDVLAMFAFSHPFAALLMASTGLTFLSALGLTISSAMRVQTIGEKTPEPPKEKLQKQTVRV